MKPIYEYLIQDIYDIKFTEDSRFWIQAVTDVTIKQRTGEFEISEDDEEDESRRIWTKHKTFKLDKGKTVYLYTSADYTWELEYTGLFNIGGDIRGLVSKKLDYIPLGRFRSSFKDSNVVDASRLDLSKVELNTLIFSDLFCNCKHLIAAPELPMMNLAPDCYMSMFNRCISLTKAPDLPATTLADGCYTNMFSDCIKLIAAPDLPATTIADGCYIGMFWNCRSLIKAPSILPAMTLARKCYSRMFSECIKLKKAPELPAKTLAEGCYQYMFEGCTSLKQKPKSGVDLTNDSYCENIFKNTNIKI